MIKTPQLTLSPVRIGLTGFLFLIQSKNVFNLAENWQEFPFCVACSWPQVALTFHPLHAAGTEPVEELTGGGTPTQSVDKKSAEAVSLEIMYKHVSAKIFIKTFCKCEFGLGAVGGSSQVLKWNHAARSANMIAVVSVYYRSIMQLSWQVVQLDMKWKVHFTELWHWKCGRCNQSRLMFTVRET